ncbi:MAG: acyltransferase family protein [Kordiimonadaceae bacterium]|jgi:glucans biosynthesis protein C|nr:acyltransferase family protein [Kordiimonadaceae bacterium]
MTYQHTTPTFGGRQHFLDWLRVLAFAYLVFFHTGMMFVDWDFHIESGHDSEFLKSIMMLTTTWRLDLLFLVSGVAISFMMTKMTIGGFLKQRMVKLFVPLFFACAVIVAPQPYFEAVQKGLLEPGYWYFWTEQYFHFTWLEGMLSPWPTYNHMWYVLYLLLYTVLLVPLFMFIKSEKGKSALSSLEKWITKGSRILWAPYILYLSVFFYTGHNDITHAVWDDWFGHFVYAYILVLGVIFVRMPKTWQAFEDNRYISLLLALASYSIILVKHHLVGDPLQFISWDLMEMVMKWSWVATLIGFARHYLNFSNKTLKYCNSIVYPFFILHQSVTIIIGYYIIDWGLNGVFEFLAVLFSTYFISLVLIEAVIKRSNILRILFGMPMTKKEPDLIVKPSSFS